MSGSIFGGHLNIRKKKNFYHTINEAGAAAAALGIVDSKSYKVLYKKDRRLPSNPMRTYELHWAKYSWDGFLACSPLH
jgi:hypothetical protein